jgi:hypothetical protein
MGGERVARKSDTWLLLGKTTRLLDVQSENLVVGSSISGSRLGCA